MSNINEPMPLLACPFCGFREGYKLAEGDTYRWWLVQCKACGAGVAECQSDQRTQAGTDLPDRWPPAEEAWNEAGRHAEELRKAAAHAAEQAAALRKDAERYRYLRNRVPAEVMGRVKRAAGCWIDCEDEDGVLMLLTGDDADETIDAAMGASKMPNVRGNARLTAALEVEDEQK